MPYKAKLSSDEFDSLGDETIKIADIYRKNDDGDYVGDFESVGDWALTNVGSLKRAKERIEATEKEQRRDLGAFKGLNLSADEIKEKLARVSEAENLVGNNEQIAERHRGEIEALRTAHAQALNESKQGTEQQTARYHEKLRELDLYKAVAESGVINPHKVLPYLMMNTATEIDEKTGEASTVIREQGKTLLSKDDPLKAMAPVDFLKDDFSKRDGWSDEFDAGILKGDGAPKNPTNARKPSKTSFEDILKDPSSFYDETSQ